MVQLLRGDKGGADNRFLYALHIKPHTLEYTLNKQSLRTTEALWRLVLIIPAPLPLLPTKIWKYIAYRYCSKKGI